MSQMQDRINRNLAKLPGLYETDAINGDLPAVYIFTPWAAATWVLWEYDPESKMAFGMADLGMGCAEMGSVYVPELLDLKGPFGLEVETDTSVETRFEGYARSGNEVPSYLEA